MKEKVLQFILEFFCGLFDGNQIQIFFNDLCVSLIDRARQRRTLLVLCYIFGDKKKKYQWYALIISVMNLAFGISSFLVMSVVVAFVE